MFETYAAKICRELELKPGAYNAGAFNSMILTLPFAEAHVIATGREPHELPRLGETVAIHQHMRSNFFEVVEDPERALLESTAPVMVKRAHLERLDGWNDWRTLASYLGSYELQPLIVFKNTPIALAGQDGRADYYMADVRVMCLQERPFYWNG
eukprot:gene17097-17288_t